MIKKKKKKTKHVKFKEIIAKIFLNLVKEKFTDLSSYVNPKQHKYSCRSRPKYITAKVLKEKS